MVPNTSEITFFCQGSMIYIMKMIRQAPPYKEYYQSICSAYRKLGLSSKIRTVLEPAMLRTFARGRRQ